MDGFPGAAFSFGKIGLSSDCCNFQLKKCIEVQYAHIKCRSVFSQYSPTEPSPKYIQAHQEM